MADVTIKATGTMTGVLGHEILFAEIAGRYWLSMSYQERFNGRKGREIQELYRSFFAGLPGPSRASLRRACFMRGCWWSRPTLGALQLSNYGVQKHAPL